MEKKGRKAVPGRRITETMERDCGICKKMQVVWYGKNLRYS